jgi:hypothetical protein
MGQNKMQPKNVIKMIDQTQAHDDPHVTDALKAHARDKAMQAEKRLGGPLTADNIEVFLKDPGCLRYKTCIVFTREGLDPHQFAQPNISKEDAGCTCTLHIDPALQNQQEIIHFVIAYMASVINYGDAATPELAEIYGSILTGLPPGQFYKQICEIADLLELPEVKKK